MCICCLSPVTVCVFLRRRRTARMSSLTVTRLDVGWSAQMEHRDNGLLALVYSGVRSVSVYSTASKT